MRLFALFAALLLLFAIPLLIFGDRFDLSLSGASGVDKLRAYGPAAGLMGMGLLVADLVLPIPSTPLMAVLGLIYGPWIGGLYGSAGIFAAGALAYSLTRSLGPRAARVLVGERDLQRAQAFFQRGGGWAVAVSRTLPLLAEVISCLAGLSGMPARRFFIALVCGSLPVGFFYAAIGDYAREHEMLALLIGALLPLPLYPLGRRLVESNSERKDASKSCER